MNIIFTLTVCNDDSANAERLLDFIHHQSGKAGHILLAMNADVHNEMKSRLRISASLAFEHVHELEIRPLADNAAHRNLKVNNAFRQVSFHAEESFSWPFMWIEPDCTPVVFNWRDRLAKAYSSQPFPYFGNRMRIKSKKEDVPDVYFMSRVGIYPNVAASKMAMTANNPTPFEIMSSKVVNPRLGPTKLFQPLVINSEDDLISVRDDAIFVHGDKHGHLMNQMKAEQPHPEAIRIQVTKDTETATTPAGRRKPARNGASL